MNPVFDVEHHIQYSKSDEGVVVVGSLASVNHNRPFEWNKKSRLEPVLK